MLALGREGDLWTMRCFLDLSDLTATLAGCCIVEEQVLGTSTNLLGWEVKSVLCPTIQAL